MTKNKLLTKILILLEDAFSGVAPARYARKPGSIGKTHGAINDTSPATKAMG
jgi:hypothetical protein